jgi:mono/diheme cytochrome c family protein
MGSQMVFSQRTVLGHVPLRPDKSIKVNLPANKPVILELIDGNGAPVFTMTEEHQVTAGEYTTPGAPRGLFNGICGGCHGSITGAELDVSVTADALTGASVSMSRDADPLFLQN